MSLNVVCPAGMRCSSFRSAVRFGPIEMQFEAVWRTRHSLLGRDKDKCLKKGRKEVPTSMLECYEVKVHPTLSSNEPQPVMMVFVCHVLRGTIVCTRHVF